MARLFKVLAIIVVGVPIVLFGIYWYLGSSAESRVRDLSVEPSPQVLALAARYHIRVPVLPNTDCSQLIGGTVPLLGRWGTSLRLSSSIGAARSAESAAVQYSQQRDYMAEVATADAMDRWQKAWWEKYRLDCFEIQSARGSY